MLVRCLSLSLALTVLVSGCHEQDPLAQLRRDNPFSNLEMPDPATILIVTCHYIVMEIPSHIDVGALPFWNKFDFQSSELPPVDAVVSGFSTEQLRLWNENGLTIALAPINNWKTFVEGLTAHGANQIVNMVSTFRNAGEVADIPMYWHEQPRSVFVSDTKKGAIRGDTLTSGNCFFRVNCVPGRMEAPVDTVYVKIAPTWRSDVPEMRLADNEAGFIRIRPEIIFEQLVLSEILKKDHFIAIAVKSGELMTGNLGQLFLSRSTGAENYQLVVLLAPNVRTAAKQESDKTQDKQ